MSATCGAVERRDRLALPTGPGKLWTRVALYSVPPVLLLVHFFLMLSSSLTKSVTADEQLHLLAGYSSLALRDFGYSQQHHHPALGTMLNALPLLFVKDLHVPPTAKAGGDPYPWRTQFLFQQSIPADTLLLWCRIPTMLLSTALGIVIYLFAKQLYGAPAACVVLGIHVLSPNILAHGQVITTDMIATVLIFTTCWALWNYLETHRRAWLVATAILSGAALVAKLTCVVVIPVLVLALAVDAWQSRTAGETGQAFGRLVRRLGFVSVVGFATIWAVYGFEIHPAYPETRKHPTLDRLIPTGRVGAGLVYALEHVPVPAPSYVRCWGRMQSHQGMGQPTFLHGRYSETGWWYYYLVAGLIKSPPALFALLLLALFASGGMPTRVTPFAATVAFPMALILLMSTASNQNIGLRHVLPVFPFVHLLVGGSLKMWRRPWARVVLVALLAWYASAAVRVYPHYLAYFNEFVGGPANGYQWLVDSNLDWGQDLKSLATYVHEKKYGRISLAYFGNAKPDYYQIDYTQLPVTMGVNRTLGAVIPRPTSGIVAISATELQDVYSDDKQRYAWLRKLTPFDNVGYSIFLYDLGRP